MVRKRTILGVVFLLGLAGICKAGDENLWQQETLTNGCWGLNDQLADSGIELGFGITNVYQVNTHGGTSTHARRGRHSGSYDLELSADLQKLLGFETGSIYMLVEGGWPDAEGIDEASVSSAFGVNADAIGNQGPLVKELYYQGPIFSDGLTMMIGKIDFTGVFDASAYADDECSQFLNAALVDGAPTVDEYNWVDRDGDHQYDESSRNIYDDWNNKTSGGFNNPNNSGDPWANTDDLLEDWGGETLTKFGSTVHLGGAVMAQNLDNSGIQPGELAWIQRTGYQPPIRVYTFDPDLATPAGQPP